MIQNDKPAAGQVWSAEEYARHGRFVASELGQPVFSLLAPGAGEQILDLGCGDGFLTEKIAAAGAHVTGIDADERMVEATRKKGIQAHSADARKLPYAGEFDAVFSNAALHWILEADDVLHSINRALKPGGRFVAEFGGFGNIAAIRAALHSVLLPLGRAPLLLQRWYFPTVSEYKARLVAAGFEASYIELIPRPVQLSTDMMGWLETFTGGIFDGVDEAARMTALTKTCQILQPILRDADGQWWADYVRLRLRAIKPQ